jgi:hypothetical protein
VGPLLAAPAAQATIFALSSRRLRPRAPRSMTGDPTVMKAAPPSSSGVKRQAGGEIGRTRPL